MTRERLELVTRFDDLRAGMLVVVKNCRRCGQVECRGMLLRLDSTMHTPDGGPGWEVYPSCLSRRTCISRTSIAERRVYRVVDPDAEAEGVVEHARPLERTR